MLPVFPTSETSVKIKVQHDDAIHCGVCQHAHEQLQAVSIILVWKLSEHELTAFAGMSPTCYKKWNNHGTTEYLQLLKGYEQKSSWEES